MGALVEAYIILGNHLLSTTIKEALSDSPHLVYINLTME